MFRKTVSWTITCVLLVSGVLAISGGTAAHIPTYESGGSTMDTALRIQDPSTSYATYAEFPALPNQIQFYSLSVSAGQKQYIEIDVPALDQLRLFAPILLLIGPGLPSPDSNASYLLGFYHVNLATGQGAYSWNFTGPLDDEEFEPFTQVTLLKRQSVNLTLSDDGTYYIAVAQKPFVANPIVEYLFYTTKYILVTGTLEKFSVMDYISIPFDWIRGHVFWDESPALFLLPTYAIVVAGLAVTAYLRRSRSVSSIGNVALIEQFVFYAALGGGLLMFAGGVNQLIFLFGSPRFSLGAGETIVLMLQTIGIVLGALALRESFLMLRPARWIRIVVASLVFVVALIVGAGFIIGPILFLAAAGAWFYLSRPKSPVSS